MKWLKGLKDKLKLSARRVRKIMKIISTKNNVTSLAIMMDVNRNTITKYENGEILPSLAYSYKFCVKFALSMDEILKKS